MIVHEGFSRVALLGVNMNLNLTSRQMQLCCSHLKAPLNAIEASSSDAALNASLKVSWTCQVQALGCEHQVCCLRSRMNGNFSLALVVQRSSCPTLDQGRQCCHCLVIYPNLEEASLSVCWGVK